MKISRILHAGYVFESKGQQIIFDPIFENPFSKNGYAYPSVQFDLAQIQKLKPLAVFISHYHDDHCSMESLSHLNRETVIYLYCLHDELFSMIKALGFLHVYSLKTDEAVRIGNFEIIPRLALDSDVDSIFHIKAEGINILNVVDAWIDPTAIKKLKENSWDLILWPFQTMREIEVIAPDLAQDATQAHELPIEWLEQMKDLNPKMIVPSSCQFIQEEWSWYRKAYFPISYQSFQKQVKAHLPKVKIQRLNPGVSIELTDGEMKAADNLSWIKPIGEQDVDYEYDPNIKPTPTSEIAKHFTKVSEEQKMRVIHFCENELIEKYNASGSEVSGIWNLEFYDHQGERISFSYEIKKGGMKLLKNPLPSDWITQVPLIKVFSALEEGESLSSMYVRIQGMPMSEIGEDPLISTVFSGDFGSYQRAQLKRLGIEI